MKAKICTLLIILIFCFVLEGIESSDFIAIVKSKNLSKYNMIIHFFELSKFKLENYKTIVFDGEGKDDKIRKIFSELLEKKPKLIITIGIQSTTIAQELISNFPILFCGVHNWEKYTQKKENITGIESFIPPNKLLKYFSMINPTEIF